MNAIDSVLRFDSALFERLAAALLHFVWQGALVALAYAAADRHLKRRGTASNARYALACGALQRKLPSRLYQPGPNCDSGVSRFIDT